MRIGIDMSIPTIERPTFGAQLGGNIGKSLAEQIPQEVGRQRLAYALKNMQGKNQTSAEQAQILLSHGGNLQDIAAMLPILQQTQDKRILEQQAAGEKTPSSVAGIGTPEQIEPPGKYATSAQIKAMEQAAAQRPTQGQIAKLALAYGGGQGSEEKARKFLEYQTDNQKESLKTFEDKFDKNFQFLTQSGGLKDFAGDITSGKTRNWALKQGEYLIRNRNYTPEAAAHEMTEKIEDFGKSLGRAAASADSKPFNEALKDIEHERETAKDMEQLDQFDKIMMKRLNVSAPHYFSKVAPITNEKLKKEVEKSVTRGVDYFIKHAIPRMTAEDNPQSLLYDLSRAASTGKLKGKFSDYIDALRSAEHYGKIHLTKENTEVLNNFTPDVTSLWEVLFRD